MFDPIEMKATRILERPDTDSFNESVHWHILLNNESVYYSEGLGHFMNFSFGRSTYAEREIKKVLLGSEKPSMFGHHWVTHEEYKKVKKGNNFEGRFLFSSKLKKSTLESKGFVHCGDSVWIKPPTIKDVMYSLVMDSDAIEYSFSEWCDNLGYDNDSIKAKAIYEACTENFKKVYRLGIDLQKAQEYFQDY